MLINMTNLVNFEVGKKYKNRKGTYEVLAIDGDVMHISWKGSKEIATTTVTMQSRIIEHIQTEISEKLALIKAASPVKKRRAAVSV